MTRSSAPRLLCALAFLGLAGTASANLTKPVYSSAKDEVKAMFKAERDKCDSLSGNAKDVCVERAKGHEKVALAHLVGDPQEGEYAARDNQNGQNRPDLAGDPGAPGRRGSPWSGAGVMNVRHLIAIPDRKRSSGLFVYSRPR